MKRKGETEYKHSLFSASYDYNVTSNLKFLCPDFPSVMDYDLEL